MWTLATPEQRAEVERLMATGMVEDWAPAAPDFDCGYFGYCPDLQLCTAHIGDKVYVKVHPVWCEWEQCVELLDQLGLSQ